MSLPPRLIHDDRLKGKHVCADCFTDYAIRQFVSSHLKSKRCTYCGRTSQRLISASLCEVLHFMMDGILSEWVVCTPQVEWQAENLGWHGGMDSRIGADHVIQRVLPEFKTAKGELLKDILCSIPSQWRPKRRCDPEPEDFFCYRWDEFAYAVKYHTRYIYYRINADWQKDITRRNMNSSFKIRPSHVIEEVLDEVSNLDIAQTIPCQTTIWRVRPHRLNKRTSAADQLGPPSIEQDIGSTRMSPAGIPVFYGSLDRDTAIAETLQIGQSKRVSLTKK